MPQLLDLPEVLRQRRLGGNVELRHPYAVEVKLPSLADAGLGGSEEVAQDGPENQLQVELVHPSFMMGGVAGATPFSFRTWSFTHLGYVLVWEGSENGLCMVFFLPNLVHPSVLVDDPHEQEGVPRAGKNPFKQGQRIETRNI